jgi:hypothetical protein
MHWIEFREWVLLVLGEPVLFLLLLFLFCFFILWPLSLDRSTALIVSLAFSLCGSLLYSPLATSVLDHWLQRQLPLASELSVGSTPPPVAVLLGRGPEIGLVSTTAAVAALQRGEIQAIYVSGDQRSTAERRGRGRSGAPWIPGRIRTLDESILLPYERSGAGSVAQPQ